MFCAVFVFRADVIEAMQVSVEFTCKQTDVSAFHAYISDRGVCVLLALLFLKVSYYRRFLSISRSTF